MSDKPAGVPFAPRSTANCIDLAVMYVGRRLPAVMLLWTCAAVPACALVYVLSYYYEFDLRFALLVIYLATAIMGSWLIVAVTPGAFRRLAHDGEPPDPDRQAAASSAADYLNFAAIGLAGGLVALLLSPASLLAGLADELSLLASVLLGIVLFARAVLFLGEQSGRRLRVGPPLRAALLMRAVVGFAPIVLLSFINGWTIFLAVVFMVFPGIPLAARYGFASEKACLTQLNQRLHHRNTDLLIKSELGELFLRLCAVGLFYLLLWMVLFFTLDVAASLVFQIDILTGRLGEMDIFSSRFWTFLATDPVLLTTSTATALLAYPVVRLAWFLCYIDVRVRRDCWDLELSLAQEAERLKETA